MWLRTVTSRPSAPVEKSRFLAQVVRPNMSPTSPRSAEAQLPSAPDSITRQATSRERSMLPGGSLSPKRATTAIEKRSSSALSPELPPPCAQPSATKPLT